MNKRFDYNILHSGAVQIFASQYNFLMSPCNHKGIIVYALKILNETIEELKQNEFNKVGLLLKPE